MKLTEEQKNKIIDIIDNKLKDFYGELNDDPEKRVELGQFYTPGKVCIELIEKYNCDSLAGKNILDPTCGSGNLLIACLCAGADLDKIYGNEYDAVAVRICKERILQAADYLGLDKSGFRDWQIHQGNALQRRCLTDFGPEYSTYSTGTSTIVSHYNPAYIDDLEYAQSYDHDESREFLGETCVEHYAAKSWCKENEEAKRRAASRRASDKPKPVKKEDSGQLSLFDFGI